MSDHEKTIKVILKERGRSHGEFEDNARIAMQLRAFYRTCSNWNNLRPMQQLAFDEIALKQARILSVGSDPNNIEHWKDGAGYFTLGQRKPKRKRRKTRWQDESEAIHGF